MLIDTNLKTFLVGYNMFRIARDVLTEFLDSRPEVHNWYALLPGQLLLVSRDSTQTIAKILRERFVGEFVVVVQAFGTTSDGYMPKDFWDMINLPKSNREPGTGRVQGLSKLYGK